MTQFEKMQSLFDEIGLEYYADWSMESVYGIKKPRLINWLFLQTEDGEVDFKFDEFGNYEGTGIQFYE